MEETRLGYTGAYNNNTLNTVGKLTYQQSSTLRSNATGYVLDLRKDEEAIHPQDSNYKRLGLPVRCVSFDSITKICYNVSVVGVFLRRKLQMWCIHERGKLCLAIFYF